MENLYGLGFVADISEFAKPTALVPRGPQIDIVAEVAVAVLNGALESKDYFSAVAVAETIGGYAIWVLDYSDVECAESEGILEALKARRVDR